MAAKSYETRMTEKMRVATSTYVQGITRDIRDVFMKTAQHGSLKRSIRKNNTEPG